MLSVFDSTLLVFSEQILSLFNLLCRCKCLFCISIGDKVDLLQCGLKVREGFIFNIEIGHKVHGRMVEKGSIVVKIEKVLKMMLFCHIQQDLRTH